MSNIGERETYQIDESGLSNLLAYFDTNPLPRKYDWNNNSHTLAYQIHGDKVTIAKADMDSLLQCARDSIIKDAYIELLDLERNAPPSSTEEEYDPSYPQY